MNRQAIRVRGRIPWLANPAKLNHGHRDARRERRPRTTPRDAGAECSQAGAYTAAMMRCGRYHLVTRGTKGATGCPVTPVELERATGIEPATSSLGNSLKPPQLISLAIRIHHFGPRGRPSDLTPCHSFSLNLGSSLGSRRRAPRHRECSATDTCCSGEDLGSEEARHSRLNDLKPTPVEATYSTGSEALTRGG
jgi:hypothetical protein